MSGLKRVLDVTVALAGLCALSPLLVLIALAVWLEDGRSPWFRGVRVGRGGSEFRMVKFRSMRPEAWKSGVNSTAAGDRRITRVGRLLRRTKLDELPQLWNVMRGQMSLVGPRPQVVTDARLYTAAEREILEVTPGLTDLASIVFADEAEILAGSADPDLRYNQVIRPWKSRLALLYVERACILLDLKILLWTAVALVSRKHALGGVRRQLTEWGIGDPLRSMAGRTVPLIAYPPPGAAAVVAMYRESVDSVTAA